MYFPGLPTTLLLSLALRAYAAAAPDDKAKTKPLDPCTVASAAGSSFYDLRSLSILPPDDKKKLAKGEKVDDWNQTVKVCETSHVPLQENVQVR